MIVLDLHDFNVVSPRLEPLYRLKDHFPDFKVSLFTIPEPRKVDYGPYLVREQNAAEIRKNQDWMQLIPHGVTHESSHEMEKYDQATFRHVAIPRILDGFARYGLPYENGFCAPHWRWSQGVVDGLDEFGWWGAVLREDKMVKTKRYYQYNHLLNEPFPLDAQLLKLHGHTWGTKNDVVRCMDNLLRLPRDSKFSYATDYLETL